MLVVIAIIAILAAILFPVFAQAREKARQTACASNEKQLGLAFLQYAQDYDETMAAGTIAAHATSSGMGAGQIYSYVKVQAGIRVPKRYEDRVYRRSHHAYSNTFSSTCGISGALAKCAAPAKTVVFLEVKGWSAPVAHPVRVTRAPGPDGVRITCRRTCDRPQWAAMEHTDRHLRLPDAQLRGSTARHTGGSNFLLLDGHVKWYRGDSASDWYFGAISADRYRELGWLLCIRYIGWDVPYYYERLDKC